MKNEISLKNLRPSLSRVVKEIDTKLKRYVVSKRGKPTVVMMSVSDYESMQETMDILSDKKSLDDIEAGIADIKKGNVTAWNDIKKKHGLSA